MFKHLNRPFGVAIFGALAIGLGCSDSSTEPDLGDITYYMSVGCIPDVFHYQHTCKEKTSAARGDSLMLYHEVIKQAGELPATITVRYNCAAQFEIRHDYTVVALVPHNPACFGDSLQTVSWFNEGHGYLWAIPSDLEPGTYSIRSVILADPEVSLTRSLVVR